MNLWVKRTGLAFAAAVLFLVSCDDESFLLGFKGKPKFQGRYHEFTFNGEKSSVLLPDSVVTDNYNISSDNMASYRFLLGQYTDPDFGIVRSEVFAQFRPNNSPINPPYFNPDNLVLVYDSTTIELVLDFYTYGSESNFDEVVNVHELTDSLSYLERYFSNSTKPYNSTPIAELSFKEKWLQYQNEFGTKDFFLKGRIDDEYGVRIFNYAKTKKESLVAENLFAFKKLFYGLAFIPSQSNRIVGYSTSLLSKLTLHYHSLTSDTLETNFYFYPKPNISANSFSKISTQRTGGLADITNPDEPYFPYNDPNSNERYIQDGSTVVTEFDLSDYYSFVDTLDNIIINSAEISIGIKPPPEGMHPPAILNVILMKKTADDKIVPLDMSVNSDSIKLNQFNSVFTDLKSYSISNELTNISPLELTYDKNTQRYVGYASMFFQALFKNKNKPEYKIEHISFYPVTAPQQKLVGPYQVSVLRTGIGNTVNRVILKSDDLKLKIYYTKPNLSNLQ